MKCKNCGHVKRIHNIDVDNCKYCPCKQFTPSEEVCKHSPVPQDDDKEPDEKSILIYDSDSGSDFKLSEKWKYCHTKDKMPREKIFLEKDVKEFIRLRDGLDRLYMLGEITRQEHADRCDKLAGDLK